MTNWLQTTSLVPLSPKNLRISAVLVAIYQVIVAHVLIFVIILGLAHAKKTSSLLQADMVDQKERDWMEDVPINAQGESVNTIRFDQASHLAYNTLIILYIATGVGTVYLICSLGLLTGALQYKSELMLPWLVLDTIGGFVFIVAVIFAASSATVQCYFGGQIQYWIFCGGIAIFNVVIWFVVLAYYLNLRHLKKLTEVATVPIPCPPPGALIPYYYRKENMYLGSGGYKHLLTENPNYVI